MRARQTGAHLGGTVMVQRAREPQHQPAADASASNLLPYDPEEWKQRVAAARAQREEVLRQRAEEQQRMAGERQPVGPFERADLPIMVPTPSVPALLNASAGKQPKAVGVIPYFSNLRPSLASLAQIRARPLGGPVPPDAVGAGDWRLGRRLPCHLWRNPPSGIDPQSESAPPVSSARSFHGCCAFLCDTGQGATFGNMVLGPRRCTVCRCTRDCLCIT